MRVFCLVVAALLGLSAHGQTLYAVSVRTFSDASSTASEGSIYRVDPSNAALQLVASLHIGATPAGLDGLAFHPKTGELYGITAPNATAAASALVRVDAKTGEVSVVGALGHAASDIAFDPDGILFAWLTDLGQVATIDLATGRTTPRGMPSSQRGIKGGIAIVGEGRAIIAAGGSAGTLDAVDLATGGITQGPALKGAPLQGQINGLAYSPQGVLLAINTSFAANSAADLVKIDPSSGVVTRIGPLPTGTDALAFRRHERPPSAFDYVRAQWRAITLGLLLLVAAVVLFVGMRRGGPPR